MKKALSSIVVALALCAGAPVASAQSADPAAAEALFREGRKLADAGDYAGACAKFSESERLEPAIGTVFNIGDCEERQGHLARAWTLYRQVVQRLPPNDGRRVIAEKRVAALEPKLPRLSVRLQSGAPAGSRIERDGVELGSASLGSELPVDPGEHVVLVSAPGHETREFRVTMREAEVLTLDVAPGAPVTQRNAEPPPPPATSQPSSSSGQRTAGYVIGGLGLAGLVTGAIAGYLVLDAKSTVDEDCDAEKRCGPEGVDAAESGKTFGVVTTVGLAVGALGLGVGSYLVLSAGPEREGHGASARAVFGGRF